MIVSTSQARTTKQRYYHAAGVVSWIGKHAAVTQYSPNPRKKHHWQAAVKFWSSVRDDAWVTMHPAPDWAAIQITAATKIAQMSGGDPWPNCPDPFDGGGTWTDTLRCENGGNWYDSPGYYRCGLQFDPAWERRFGYKFCP